MVNDVVLNCKLHSATSHTNDKIRRGLLHLLQDTEKQLFFHIAYLFSLYYLQAALTILSQSLHDVAAWFPCSPSARPPALSWEFASPKQPFLEISRLVGPQKGLLQSGTCSSLACISLGGTGSRWEVQPNSAALPFAAKGVLVLCWQCGIADLIHRQLNRWQSLRRKQRGILNLWIIWGFRQDDPEAHEILQCIFSSWNNRDFSSHPT